MPELKGPLWEQLVAHAPAAIASFDKDMCLIAASKRWLEDFGLDESAKGQSLYEILPEIKTHRPDWLELHKRCLAGEKLSAKCDPLTRQNGSTDYLRWDMVPNVNDAGEIEGLIFYVEFATMRVESENQLRHKEALIQKMGDVARIGHWRFDPVSEEVTWSEQVFKIHGVDPTSFVPTLSSAVEFYHPEDRDKVRQKLDYAVANKQGFNFVYRIIRQDGTLRYVRSRGTPELDDESNVTAVFGVFQDVSEQQATFHQLQNRESLFSTAFKGAAHGIAIVGTDGRWLQVNEALCKLVGYTQEELLETDFQAITHPADLEIDLEYVRECLVGKRNTYHIEKRYIKKDGSQIWVLLSVGTVRDKQGNPVQFVSQIQDITPLRGLGYVKVNDERRA